MFCPPGYINFTEIKMWAREVARDVAWQGRQEGDVSGGITIKQRPGERDAIEAWAVSSFLQNVDVLICSPSGVLLRAPHEICRHFDQLDLSPLPFPLEDSTVVLPNYSDEFILSEHHYFRNRFAYFSWILGCVDVSKTPKRRIYTNEGVWPGSKKLSSQ